MKRLSLAFILVCLTLSVAAQDVIKVNYKGARPTISDFVTAFVSSQHNDEEEECFDESFNAIKQTWIQHLKGLPLEENETLTVDEKNGYVLYESRQDEYVGKWEMCYWNEADGKHKLFAYNVSWFKNGKYSPGQFDGLIFYRYNNATKKMTYCDAPGFDAVMGSDDGAMISYALPRSGKDIIATYWYDDGKKKQKTLKWNGRRFSF